MIAVISYLGVCCASWTAMGLFCLRSDAIRGRYRWPKSAEHKHNNAALGSLAVMLTLAMLWRMEPPGFALILWVLLHGLSGVAIAFCLPYAKHHLPRTVVASAVMATISLPIIYFTSGV